MTRLPLLAGSLIAVLVASPALAADAAASFKGSGGADVGTARLSEGPTGVLVRLDLKGLKPGWHAIHFHAKGDCSDAAFNAAGGHINHATPKPHGLLNAAGPDFGDLPNVYAASDGTAKADIFSALVSFSGEGGRPGLKDADGSALVIHENLDDYMAQPIGGAGARVACAVIR
ncbi:MAG: superoxide dismutase [Caulobacterales bacterium 32-69-10]|nr:MAG: superoxide dismutase [Caulobacterales bacterium 32-69-10]